MSDRAVGLLAAATAAVMFGSSTVATAFVLRTFDPIGAAAWRSVLGLLLLGPIVLAQARRAPPAVGGSRGVQAHPSARARAARLVILGLIGGPTFLITLNLAVAAAGAAISGMAVGMYAVVAVVLGGPLLGELVRRGAFIGLGIALGGTVLLAGRDGPAPALGGIAVGLLAASSYACYLVLARRWGAPYRLRSATITLSSLTLTAAVMFPASALLVPGPLWPVAADSPALLALAWIGFVLAAGQLLIVVSVQRVDAKTSSTLLLLNPLTAAALAVVLLGEQLSGVQLGGAVLVLLGMGVAARSRVAAPPHARSRPLTGTGPDP